MENQGHSKRKKAAEALYLQNLRINTFFFLS